MGIMVALCVGSLLGCFLLVMVGMLLMEVLSESISIETEDEISLPLLGGACLCFVSFLSSFCILYF